MRVSPPAVGLRLQQLYQATLRHFDQVYASSTQARSLQTAMSGQAPPVPSRQQPAEADRETLLVDSTSQVQVTRLLPHFSGTPGAELGMTGAGAGQQNREHLKHLARDQNRSYADLGTRAEDNAQPAAIPIARLSQAFGDQGVVHPSLRSIPNHKQQVRLVVLHRTFKSQRDLRASLFTTCLLES
jgi:hypothetical protein